MSTTSSIGTAGGRAYSTISGWLAAFTTGGWIGELYDDGPGVAFSLSSGITFNQSTSATNFVTLRCGAGQSFKDNANKLTNALTYNTANGVSITTAANYITLLSIATDYVTLEGLQVQAAHFLSTCIDQTSAFTHTSVSQCIFENTASLGTSFGSARAGTFANLLILYRTPPPSRAVGTAYTSSLVFANCTVALTSNNSGAGVTAFSSFSGSTTLINCAIFGWATAVDTNGNFSGNNNCSDVALGFGSSNQASKTYANQFVNTTNASRDFRAKAGADLVDNGATATTQIPSAVDIVGTSRPQGSAWDIGAWELASSGVTATAAWTESQDAWAISGQTGVFGTVAYTETQDSWAISASVRVDGSVAWTEGQDAWAISATVSGGGVTGDAAWTEIQDVWAVSGQTGVFAAAAWTEAQDTWNVVATMGVFGTAAWAEVQDTWNATGTVSLPSVTGDIAWVEVQDSWNVQGTSGAQGGHFIPLTEKQLRELKKRERRDAQLQRDLDHSRKLDADAIENEVRANLAPKAIKQELSVNSEQNEVDDDDDEDLELILLHA